MTQARHILTIIFFVILCTTIIVFSLFLPDKESTYASSVNQKRIASKKEQSFFKEVQYYIVKNDLRFLHLIASELSLGEANDNVVFFNPLGKVYSEGQVPINFKGMQGLYKKKLQELVLENQVELDTEESTIKADKITYLIKKDEILSFGNVRANSAAKESQDTLNISANSMIAWPQQSSSLFKGNVKGKITRKKIYEENISFKSHKLYMDLNKQHIRLDDDVFIKKQQVRAQANRGEIFLENYNKKLKYFVLYDDVKVVEKVKLGLNGRTFNRRAFSEKLEAIMSESKIILTGYPKVFQLNDKIIGNKIILRENTEVVEVDDANTSFKIR